LRLSATVTMSSIAKGLGRFALRRMNSMNWEEAPLLIIMCITLAQYQLLQGEEPKKTSTLAHTRLREAKVKRFDWRSTGDASIPTSSLEARNCVTCPLDVIIRILTA